jgi:hypothetical protein
MPIDDVQPIVAPLDAESNKPICSNYGGGGGSRALLAAVGIVAPAEAEALSVEGQQAMVGDGDAMGIATEVVQDMGRAGEGRLGIDEPSLVGQLRGQFLEPRMVLEVGCRTSAVEQALAVELPESVEEFIAEYSAQDSNRQQE